MDVKEKETTIKVGSGWIAVLRLFMDIGWDKLGASNYGNYWKLAAFRRNPDKPLYEIPWPVVKKS